LKQLRSLTPSLAGDQALCVFDPAGLFHSLIFLRLATHAFSYHVDVHQLRSRHLEIICG
jgi:hypothetical protein